MTRRTALILLLLALSACRKEEDKEGTGGAEKKASMPTPVRVAAVGKAALPLIVSGSGKTATLTQQKIRAPFAGTLTALHVFDGDPVRRGQTIGSIVARDSEAALSGAREMLRQASTAAERRDAVLVADEYQGRGLGKELLRRLIQVAREQNLNRVVAEMLRDNIIMQTVFKKLGFRLRLLGDPRCVRAVLDL